VELCHRQCSISSLFLWIALVLVIRIPRTGGCAMLKMMSTPVEMIHQQTPAHTIPDYGRHQNHGEQNPPAS